MRILTYAGVVLIGLLGLGVMLIWLKDYFIQRHRKEDRAEKFTEHFARLGVSVSLAAAVRGYLRSWMSDDGFPVRPEDDLHLIYGMVDEDLDEMIIKLSMENDLEIPEDTTYFPKPIATVDDVIRFIDSFHATRRV